MSDLFQHVNLAEAAILLAALAYVVDRTLDALGISRSSRTLRVENEDLVRRNHQLDAEVVRLSAEVARLDSEAVALRTQVQDLAKRDQGAVLHAIATHETSAGARHERTLNVLTEIRDAVRAT